MTAPAPRSNWDRSGLPAWAYHSPALCELEKAELFATHWQIVCHVADVAEPGAYVTLDVGDERVLVLRGADGVLRAMHNLCRHRGARVAPAEAGRCRNALVCPFHGWVYNLDGSLRGPAQPRTFAPMDRAAFGLKPVECEIWQGFVFVRCKPGPQAGVAETFAAFAADLGDYRIAEAVPAGGFQRIEVAVNWKSIRDVDNEGYHVAMAHPALQDLYGAGYRDMTAPGGLSWSIGPFDPRAGRRWSVRNYLAIAPEAAWLPEDKRRRWAYYGLFPNTVLSLTPETVQFYQELPLAVDRALIRGATYRRPDESRRGRLARYLAARIDRETQNEDVQLSVWSNEAMKSSAFEGFHLSDLEFGVRNHHDQLRRVLPVLTVAEAPAEDRVRELNEALGAASTPEAGNDGRPTKRPAFSRSETT
jgi:phenylpropionate dioxygenase-like ring-hydroxylating dioxygenase large terminal subunit